MKKLAALAFLIVTIFLITVAGSIRAQENQINWEKDFKTALLASRASGKPILLFFTASDCPAGDELERQYWSTETVNTAVGQFVPVRVNLSTAKTLSAKYKVADAPLRLSPSPIRWAT